MRDYEEKSYYEIQLDNKQLILVFLAALTLCVLIFVLGVMVGKGQKEAEMAAMARSEGTPVKTEPDPNVPEQPKETVTPAPKSEKAGKTSKTGTLSNPAQGDGFYGLDQSEESQKGLEPKKEPVTAKPETKVPEVSQQPVSTLFTVQLMATESKSKAQEQVRVLKARGYNPFMSVKETKKGNVYKVRVGKYSDTAAAKEMAARLKQNLKLEPWVTELD